MEGYNAEKRIAMAVTDVRRSLRQTNTCAGLCVRPMSRLLTGRAVHTG